MNRFRTKKKVKELKEDVSISRPTPRPSEDSESSTPFRPFSKKGKKVQETEKIDIDLSTALPSTDNFRTSLLMTGLSARFSMLREQDDPSTKIGKASDDSVLFPKRQSRLDYGGFHGLGDIAEVESIRAAAPFARKNSYNSDADSTKASSIMGRSKPTEGNNLFGGRQKIYKIPVGANSKSSGMGGRALYDDDVALSAFQKWRQAEREGKSYEGEGDEDERRDSGDPEPDNLRAESPISSNYNQKRETSSTTFSMPSLVRNSTAATSVSSSQRASSIKDWQPSNSSTSTTERSVTRTRRLYESGLNNDLHEQQSSAFSRIDSLTRQRTFGALSPDLAQNSPSPTTIGFVERFSGERRILAKSSAPNLRSMSPPTTASSAGTPDLGARAPSATEMRSNFGGAPPLSPPISETEENSMLMIHPYDLGKATALGVFQKPLQPYDESRYAQRQLQRQQGRDTPSTPTLRSHDEPNRSFVSDRSSSSSSAQKKESDSKVDVVPTVSEPLQDEEQGMSFLADPNDSESSRAVSPQPSVSPQVVLRRPSDHEHPALRESIVSVPVSEPSPVSDRSMSLSPRSSKVSPADSPTLGPTAGAGLSGMVREHLRRDSNASSIYGAMPSTAGMESRFPEDLGGSDTFQDLSNSANPWESADGASRDWSLDLDVNEPMPDTLSQSPKTADPEEFARIRPRTLPNARNDGDEFADQLADGARRVRERLTTYVESDSRSASPNRLGDNTDARDSSQQKQNGLGFLQLKSSRGSFVERGRDISQLKALKMLGMGSSNSSRDLSTRDSSRERKSVENSEREDKTTSGGESNDGLRTFRQAKRELQKMKDMEIQILHPSRYEPDSARSTPTKDRPSSSKHRSPERDRKPPPMFFQKRSKTDIIPSEEPRPKTQESRSREVFRSNRARSSSESSTDGRPRSRTIRATEKASGRGNLQVGPNGNTTRPMLRSPGLPGTDIKRSPIMPPHPYPGSTQSRPTNLMPDNNLRVQTSHGFESDVKSRRKTSRTQHL
ncbi:uncharacterized protein GGS25DRAFT_349353 [Hypoxylon fragiforme]|uniref:uncharacterized protein n=1 Tax=Hypoxylon fragiforme TaxID=63214 RepID=UPI0020C60152|nr:uncharacterized protein GGS25DRAFT_349353 [Hypoxylon fragiforme]KAI2607766.1 hypothetical protein GGS25DRAFT_349353 [Hypoxylon fragiforme]